MFSLSRRQARWRCCFGLALAVLLPVACSTAAVTVETRDGRNLTGEVDLQTDDQLLWIRQEKANIILSTSVPWSEVVTAYEEQEPIPLEKLQEILRPQATSEPIGFLVRHVVQKIPTTIPGDSVVRAALAVHPTMVRPPQVRSLNVEAFLVNLDPDVEPDGIELAIGALDEHGIPVPVKGSLSVRLIGERIQPHGSLVQYEELQRWNQPVVPVDFHEGVASYALPFRTVHPEYDVGLHSDALIEVRLGVFGQGNFSASVPVLIRPFNPVRDRLQLTRGGRFFPNERAQRGRYQLRPRTRARQPRNR